MPLETLHHLISLGKDKRHSSFKRAFSTSFLEFFGPYYMQALEDLQLIDRFRSEDYSFDFDAVYRDDTPYRLTTEQQTWFLYFLASVDAELQPDYVY
jgi:hypothetical protein